MVSTLVQKQNSLVPDMVVVLLKLLMQQQVTKTQWGKIEKLNKNLVVNFSVSYQSYALVFMNTLANSNDNGGDAYANWVYNITTNSFVYDFYNTAIATKKGLWFSVGVQQWGATTSTTGNLTISYPITFNVVHSLGGMTITSGTMTGSNQCLAVKSVTTSSFVSHMYDNGRGFAGRYWCAIGEQQWGTSTSEKTKTFPIAFSNSCYSVLNIMNVNSNRYENPYVIDVTASSFKSGLSGVNYAMYWIAVGKQQWGKITDISSGGNTNTAITFPVTITTLFTAALTSVRSSDSGNGWNYIHSITTTTMKGVFAGTEGRWLIVAKQQWGDLSMTSSKKTFPISFTSTTYQVIGGIADSTYPGSYAPVYITVNSITTTGFTNPDTSGYIGGKRTWVAIGKQQWGRFSVGASEKQFALPIAFPNAILTASRWQSNKSEDTNIRVNISTNTYIVAYNHGGTPTAQGYIVLGY